MEKAPSGFPITIYNLEGEARWSATTENGSAIGIEVKESLDFEKWRDRFEDDDDAIPGEGKIVADD